MNFLTTTATISSPQVMPAAKSAGIEMQAIAMMPPTAARGIFTAQGEVAAVLSMII